MIWATHPLTWLIAYAGVEGTVRLVSAAFTENNLGTLPLFAVDKMFSLLTGSGRKEAATAVGGEQGNVSSYFGAIGEKLLVARLPQVPDEISVLRNESDAIIEIRACRRKEDWIPPRIVRYQNEFYRLEESSRGTASRPYLYTLPKRAAVFTGSACFARKILGSSRFLRRRPAPLSSLCGSPLQSH